MKWKRRAFVRQPLVQLAVGLLAIYAGSQWLKVETQSRLGEKLSALAGPGDVLMVSSENCVNCVLADRWLTQHRVQFTQCFVEQDPACAATYNALLAPGTPVMLVRGERLVGFDPKQLLKTLERSPPLPVEASPVQAPPA